MVRDVPVDVVAEPLHPVREVAVDGATKLCLGSVPLPSFLLTVRRGAKDTI
jgi:hypothetical protein